jgi:DNA-nicking Smr family endonuclease
MRKTVRPAARGAAGTARSRRAPDELAALRGTLAARDVEAASGRGNTAVAQTARTTPCAETDHRPATSTEDAAWLHAAFSDVAPLRDRGRIELEPPKPAAVPRPRAPDPNDTEPAPATSRQRAPASEAALFRTLMADVTPLRDTGRVEIGVARRRRARDPARHGAATEDPARDAIPTLLPPDPERLGDDALFQHAVRGAVRLDRHNRVELARPQPDPQPIKRSADERAVMRETMEAPLTLEDRLDIGDEAAFLRPGLPRRVLTDLRRARWVLQAELDLHGLNREEARSALAEFLARSLQQGRRCVRVIHGKGIGSPGRQSILKQLSRGWLAQREEILAFCQAGPHHGGEGALLVLLRGPGSRA